MIVINGKKSYEQRKNFMLYKLTLTNLYYGETDMKEIIAHEMQYQGERVTSSVDIINYCDKYYNEYRNIYNSCFRDMRIALELNPDCCNTREQLVGKKSDIYLLFGSSDLIGSVAVYGKEIDDLIVAPKYQGKGYGKLLLLYAISYMQRTEKEPIILHVADWNRNAISLYLSNGFKVVKTWCVNKTIQAVEDMA
jgi:GNAT superfamily N-acetyltransferase